MLLGLCVWALVSDFPSSVSGGKIVCSGKNTDIADRTHGSTG